mmetsp:Transcript_25553/g.76875  ORF Transcript_25553/g.76875 Transcript_25553/m.76875 type:complete len:253 (-) Transcript_25553:503-1261(-)
MRPDARAERRREDRLLPRRDAQNPGGSERLAADDLPLRAAPPQPHPRPLAGAGRGGRRPEGRAVRPGVRGEAGWPQGGHVPARPLGPPGLQQDQGARRPGPRARDHHRQRPDRRPRPGLPQDRLRLPGARGLRDDRDRGRRHGDAAGRPRAGHRRSAAARVRAAAAGSARHGLPAHRHSARRGRQGHGLPRARGDLLPGHEHLQGVLQDGREDGGGHRRRGVAALRGHRPLDRGRPLEDHRPEEEHLQTPAR